MRNYKSITKFTYLSRVNKLNEVCPVNMIYDDTSGDVYDLDENTKEIFSVNFSSSDYIMNFKLNKYLKNYFFKFQDIIEIWYDEPCLYS